MLGAIDKLLVTLNIGIHGHERFHLRVTVT